MNVLNRAYQNFTKQKTREYELKLVKHKAKKEEKEKKYKNKPAKHKSSKFIKPQIKSGGKHLDTDKSDYDKCRRESEGKFIRKKKAQRSLVDMQTKLNSEYG